MSTKLCELTEALFAHQQKVLASQQAMLERAQELLEVLEEISALEEQRHRRLLASQGRHLRVVK